MKIVLKTLVILLGVAAAALAVFLATFNADRYRPWVEKKLSEATGQPVRVEKVSLSLLGGIALELKGLNAGPGLKVEQVSALLKIKPLLKRDIQIGSVQVIRPNIHLVRQPDGTFGLKGAPAAPRGAAAPSSAPAVPAAAVLIDRLEVRDAAVRVEDPAAQPPMAVVLEGMDVTLENISLGGPISGDVRLRVERSRLEGTNLLREGLSRLTVIPGLLDTLLARLPESYRRKLEAPDAVFHPIDLRTTFVGDQVRVERFRVATDDFELAGSGQARLSGALSFAVELAIEPQLSAAIFQSVEELRFLADGQGRLVIPASLQGTLARPAVLPDIGVVAQRIFSGKGSDLLGGLLQKVLEKND